MGAIIGSPRKKPCTGRPAKPANSGCASSTSGLTAASVVATQRHSQKLHLLTGAANGKAAPSLLSLSCQASTNERYRNRRSAAPVTSARQQPHCSRWERRLATGRRLSCLATPTASRTSRRRGTTRSHLMKVIAYLAILAGITGISLYAVSSSLDDMTRIDCKAGIQRACDQLAKNK